MAMPNTASVTSNITTRINALSRRRARLLGGGKSSGELPEEVFQPGGAAGTLILPFPALLKESALPPSAWALMGGELIRPGTLARPTRRAPRRPNGVSPSNGPEAPAAFPSGVGESDDNSSGAPALGPPVGGGARR